MLRAGHHRQEELRGVHELGASVGPRFRGRARAVERLPPVGGGGDRDPITPRRGQPHGVDSDSAQAGGELRGPRQALLQARDEQGGAQGHRQGAEAAVVFDGGNRQKAKVVLLGPGRGEGNASAASPSFELKFCRSDCAIGG